MNVTTEKPWRIFLIFLRLGLTSFGGPVAHLGYFRTEFVDRRKWLSDKEYGDLVALCHFLPGPASSQVGLAIGILKARYKGAFAAWFGFTMPSALMLILFSFGVAGTFGEAMSGAIAGLKVVAVAIVAHAVWGMARTLCRGVIEIALAMSSVCALLLFPGVLTQLIAILVAGVGGYFLIKRNIQGNDDEMSCSSFGVSSRAGVLWLAVFAILLLLLPIASYLSQSAAISLFDDFYRVGSLVFGGGHVVLPLLEAEVVDTGLLSESAFLTVYGATQAVPGPLFTFAAYLGALNTSPISGILGAVVCLIAIFLPAFLLVAGSLPFLSHIRQSAKMQSALAGVNASVVGILTAALVDPLWPTAILGLTEFTLALLAFLALLVLRAPSWLVVLACSTVGMFLLGVGG